MRKPTALSSRDTFLPGAAIADTDTANGLTPPGRSPGVDDGVISPGKLFCEMTASLGIDGEPIFERLVKGQSIGRALAMPPHVVERIYARAHAWFSLGKFDRAEPLFRALCFLRDGDADFWIGFGVCLRLTGQPAKAERALAAAASLRPDWALPYFHALELAVLQKQWPQARAALDAYDARAGGDIPPQIAAQVARLRTAVEHGLAGDMADATHAPHVSLDAQRTRDP